MITLYDKAGKPHEFEETFKQEMLNVGYTESPPALLRRESAGKEKFKRTKRAFSKES